MEFINQAVTVLQTLVVALGAGLAVWGVVNLMEGYGNANDRIALVKECGFFCADDYFDFNACEDCPAKDYCDRYTDYKEDQNEL